MEDYFGTSLLVFSTPKIMEIKSIVNLPGKFWRVTILRETNTLVDFTIIAPSIRPRESLFVVLQDLIKIFQNLKSVGIDIHYLNSIREFSSTRVGCIYISTDDCIVKVRGFYVNGKTWCENYDFNGSWVPTLI